MDFEWWPLGGLGEVGMNCMVFRMGRTVIPVDAGVLFAEPNDFGIEGVYPDFENFVRQFKPRTWLITHAHEDHIGAVPALFSLYASLNLPPPTLFAPPFAAALMREKLLDPQRALGGAKYLDCIQSVPPTSELMIDDVRVKFIETRHSTPHTCSLAFEWQDRLRVLHTADFKLDANAYEDGVRDVRIYDAFNGRAPDFLFVDSTNSERPGRSVAEKEVRPGLEKLLRDVEGRAYVTLFSSNVYRVASLIQLAHRTGREVCLAGRSLQTAYRLAQDLGLLGESCPDVRDLRVLPASDLHQRPRNQQMIICSGSQGENRSVLMRLSQSQHPDFLLEPGDGVIFSSKLIPGNERAVSRLINGLLKQGAQVLWGEGARELAGGPIHASGHARADEIAELVDFVRPKNIVPVHGEYRQLRACGDIALSRARAWGCDESNLFLAEDGTHLLFRWRAESGGENSPDADPSSGPSSGRWALHERRQEQFDGRMLRFENFVAHSRDPFLRVRKRAAAGGVVSAVVDAVGRVQVSVRGLWPEGKPGHNPLPASPADSSPGSSGGSSGGSPGGQKIAARAGVKELREIENWLSHRYADLRRNGAFDAPAPQLENEVAEDLARFVRRLTGLRPFVIVHLVRL